jgi:predicted alpha/beta superfamily hydrolase
MRSCVPAALAAVALVSLAAPARAGGGDALVPVRFEVQQPTVWGESVYLLGDLPELGGGDPVRALRMRYVGPTTWRLDVALPAGATYRRVFLVRRDDADAQGDPNNARAVSSVDQRTVPGVAPQRSVRLRYVSGFAPCRLSYEQRPGRWAEATFQQVGPGRGPGEALLEVTVQTTTRELQFVPHDDHGHQDLAPDGGPYRTPMASVVLQDGELLPDLPPARRSGSRVVTVRAWYSHVLGNARDVFVYLPRDYDRTTRRYPVLYMHDGQNLFDPDAFMGGWHAGETADRLIAAGRVEDLIIVGAANTPDRMAEYQPPECGGTGDRYGRFLTDELKPWVDATFRTRPGREDTGVLGSSLGGLISFYLGWDRPDVFTRVGSLSGSFWIDGHLQAIDPAPAPKGVRFWLDSGTAGPSNDSYSDTVRARDLLLAKGLVLGRDVQHEVDIGAQHSEPYWRGRFGDALEFLFPAR